MQKIMGKIFLTDSPNVVLKMHDCGMGNYWFYHKDSFPMDEPLLYRELINQAANNIDIWDPYFNIKSIAEGDHLLFDSIQSNITIKILHQKGYSPQSFYFQNFWNIFKSIIPASKNVRLGMRFIDSGNISHKNGEFHDRFLIIDQLEVYLIGGSIGWHRESKGSTGIFKVQDIETANFIKSLFTEYWNFATQNEIPVRYL